MSGMIVILEVEGMFWGCVEFLVSGVGNILYIVSWGGGWGRV